MDESITVIDPTQDVRWDAFVQNHAFGWLCHLSGWQRVLEKSFHHLRSHYLVIVRNGAIRAGLPLYEVRSWLTGHRLVSIPFATLSDPLISTCGDMDKLVDAALGFSQDLRIPSVEIRTTFSAPYVQNGRLSADLFYKLHYLPLDQPPEELSKSFHRSCVRQRIARAKNSGIEIAEGKTEAEVKEFYDLYTMNRKRLGLPPQPYIFVKSLWETFSPQNNITFLIARKEGKLLGGLILYKFKSRVSAEFSAWDDNYLNLSPLHRLFWEAIQSAYCEGYKVFDFGRTSPNNTTLMDFKNRWGTTVVDLPDFYYPKTVCSRGEAKEESLKYKLTRKVCRIAPQPLFKKLGDFLYRHMS